MKLVFLGCGSAFAKYGQFQTNMYLENDAGERLLIDCGSDARFACAELGLSYKNQELQDCC